MKVILLFFIVPLLSSCSRVTLINVQDDVPAFSRPDLVYFQPGDIVLTISNDPASWLLSLMANPEPGRLKQAYTHGEMVFINKEGAKTLGGFSGRVMSQPLADRLPLFQHLVVLRPKMSRKVRGRLAATMAELTHSAQYRNARFDYSFRDVPGRADRFYCLGLINEVYRQAGVPIPFPHKQLYKNNLIRHAEALVGYQLSDGPVVQDIISNEDYDVVLDWSNARYGQADAWFNEHISRLTIELYDEGWELKPSDELAVSVVLWLADDESFDAVKKVVRNFERFSTEVAIDWRKANMAGQFDGYDDSAKIKALKVIASKYRDDFFVKADFAVLDESVAR
ncbi:hypothetical protein [Aquipseudomonas guryensis]|uniref:Permuted papain-like amidase enzyme, YaeF/YiiX, C92 family n=1 Tax=Aquipseudomonas guryensis TaxID=2759165 RepID=A0A7W4D7Z1_9GAMM|nr:hypothetical protein [Pseudomonas guryensis]MBB1517670.1 hypothetical protein [Pseudomonas guryensis]